MEDFNVDLIKMITDGAVRRQIDYEANAVLNTASAEGTLTPLKWIKGTDGTVITSSDVASLTMKASGFSAAVAALVREGYTRDQLIVAMHPDTVRDLLLASDTTPYVANGLSQVTTTGIIERIYGVEVLETNKIEWKDNTTNDAYNSLMFVKNHTYVLGAKRDLTIKFHEIPEDNTIGVTCNWRVKGGVLDANSIVRISTTTTNTAQ